jgi:hypothetical protein
LHILLRATVDRGPGRVVVEYYNLLQFLQGEAMGGHVEPWIAELLAGTLIPVAVIIVFSMVRDSMGIEGDNGTDFILVLISFDIALSFGYLHAIAKTVQWPWSLTLEVAAGLSCFVCVLLACVSLEFFRRFRHSRRTPAARWLDHLIRGVQSVVAYMPALFAYGLHAIPFYL